MNTNHAKYKLLSALLICVLALSALAGCSQDTGGGSGMATPPSSTETTEQTQSGTTKPDTQPTNAAAGTQRYTVGTAFSIDVPTSLNVELSENWNDRIIIKNEDEGWSIFGILSNPLPDWVREDSDEPYPMGEADGFVQIVSDDYAMLYFKSVNGDTSKMAYFDVEIKASTPGGLTVQSLLDDPQIKAMFASIRTAK